MRSLLILAPILLGLTAGGTARWIDAPPSNLDPSGRAEQHAGPGPKASAPQTSTEKARTKTRTEVVYADLPDIGALLALRPPAPEAPTQEWVAFAHSLREVDSGARYGNGGTTTPILVWYALVARYSPDAIYELYAEKAIYSSQMGHLIQFGLLPDWYNRAPNIDALILDSASALTNIAVSEGIDYARRRFADAFFAAEGKRRRFRMGGLRFSLPAMSEREIDAVIPKLQSGVFSIDVRGLRRLMMTGLFENARSEILELIVEHGDSSRSMSSYFLHGAELGNTDYLDSLIGDAADNANQPRNFYCAACGLALVSDGLLGSTLIEAVANGQRIDVERDEPEFVLSLSSGRNE